MTQFWVSLSQSSLSPQFSPTLQYSFFNNFSGQIAYESWTLSFYNVLFTLLPPLVIGIFDQFVSARILDRYPQLYMLGQSNAFFTKTAFWLWVGNALYHSVVRTCSSDIPTDDIYQVVQVAFGFSVILFWGDLKQSQGYDSGHWFWGTMLYLAVLLTVLGKAALVSECVHGYRAADIITHVPRIAVYGQSIL
jgi:phospholipid-transporting ATPase